MRTRPKVKLLSPGERLNGSKPRIPITLSRVLGVMLDYDLHGGGNGCIQPLDRGCRAFLGRSVINNYHENNPTLKKLKSGDIVEYIERDGPGGRTAIKVRRIREREHLKGERKEYGGKYD